MRRLTRSLVLLAALNATLPGAVITLTANCSDIGVTVTNPSKATCVSPLVSGTATLNASNPFFFTLSAESQALGSGSAPSPSVFGRGMLDADLLVLATGGSGAVLFQPCLSTTTSQSGINGSGSAMASFGSISRSDTGSTTSFPTCLSSNADLIALTYGTPQTFHLYLQTLTSAQGIGSSTNGGAATAVFSGARLLTVNGDTARGSVSITESTPEPSTAGFVFLGTALFLLRKAVPRPYCL